MAITVIFIRGARWQVLSFVTLAALALTAYKFPKIGMDYMPPLDEGSILDMPVTVPRASVTEATDDLKARDALLRRFPEVEMIVGKAGRADTPTDPSPLDMVESVITLRPKEYWPKRKLDYQDAEGQAAVVLAALQETRPDRRRSRTSPKRRAMLDPATMNAIDAHGRNHARTGARSSTATSSRTWARSCCGSSSPSWSTAGGRPAGCGSRSPTGDIDALAAQLRKEFAPILAAGPGQEDVNRLIQQIAEKLAATKKVELNPELLTAKFHPLYAGCLAVADVLGSEPPTLFTEMFDFIEQQRDEHWRERSPPARSRHLPPCGGGLRPLRHRGTPEAGQDEKGLWARSRRLRERTNRVRTGEERLRRKGEGDQPCVAPRQELRRTTAWSPRLFLAKKVQGRPLEGARQRGADARLGQYLDPADHQPHRHAGHGRADHDRREGLRQRPGQDPGGVRTGGRGAQAGARRGGRVPRPKPRQGLPGDQDRPRAGGPLRRQGRRRAGRDRNRAGRQGDHDDSGRARAVPGAGPLQSRLPRGRGGREEPAGQCGLGADGGRRRRERRRDGCDRNAPAAAQPVRPPRRCKSRWRWSPT